MRNPSRLRPEGRSAGPFLARVKARAALAGPSRPSRAAKRRFQAPGLRRVVVRARQVEAPAARRTGRHLGYLRRDGVGADGSPGRLYGPGGADADGEGFRDRAREDPGQVRIVLSPDDASELGDLRGFACAFMEDLERGTGRPLDWVATDHFNTGRPHVHVVLRGADAEGRPLRLDRRTLLHGLRERACDVLTRELGPDVGRALRERLRGEAGQQRATALDDGIRERLRDGLFDARGNPGSPEGRLLRARRIDRLRALSRMGLAREEEPLRWRVSPALLPALRGMAERGRTFRLLDRALREAGLERPVADRCVFDAAEDGAGAAGALVGWGTRGGARDTPYVVVDGIDGRVRYADVRELPDPPARGAVVALEPASPGLRELDARIVRAAASGALDGRAGEGGPLSGRLRSLERRGLARKEAGGAWSLAPGLGGAAHGSGVDPGYREARAVVVDDAPIGEQVRSARRTWLDGASGAGARSRIRSRGFGREAIRALDARKTWILDRGGLSLGFGPDWGDAP